MQDASDRENDDKSGTEEMGSVEDLAQDQQENVVTVANTSDTSESAHDSNSLSTSSQVLKVKSILGTF